VASKTGEEQRLQLVDDYKHVFGTDSGKRVLEDLMQASGFQMPVYSEAEDTSARGMAFRDGKRAIVSRIQFMLELSLSELQKQSRETYAQTEEQ